MSAELPLKVRVDIRDQWNSPNGLIQKSVDALQKTLGHKIVPHVQWPVFYDALKGAYTDKATFVPAIIRVVTSFYDRLLARLEDEANNEWTEKLLEELGKKPDSSWLLQIEASKGSRPQAALNVNLGVLTLEIPRRELPQDAETDSGFDKDFDDFFALPHSESSAASANDDEWAEVIPGGETRSTAQPAVASLPIVPAPTRPRALPTVERLERPAELFKSITPYILTVDATTRQLVIQGSHQPSLELLAAYLKKWAKTNMNDSQKRPVLAVTLIESAHVFGVIDGIEIEQSTYGMRSTTPLNPALILAFVEGVLGYKETHTTGTRWVYKLEAAFKH
ncbi:hypothetical protein GALMADRAFT_136727 [Galerina marginata CBS 339.88]|uniref:Uncharacterized protein n=1 Tax=Galerina marginata (strain CBS 339.88) TaxID=685588 RepID=A0A067TCW4_GALM3|nr:hypothetical protein GALMADRAFT_136727 [Galerina marginata CBS 339.88]